VGVWFLPAFTGWKLHQYQKAKTIAKEREKARERELEHAKEIEIAYAELGKSHENLKSTQAQLIQSEKMASLGELTAGIAHEIQNPLNFVNNFSEVSVDLAKELKEEFEKLDVSEKDKEYVNEIIGDLSSNQEKINHHGKRASGIVKGMLEHSRASSGKKELTDINKLCDEYLRLAYHGLRAKDKTFNAEMVTHFDPYLPKIEVIPQDIGRVILNLITNAFYAVNERANLLNLERQSGDANLTDLAYAPKVTVKTHLTANSQILISVKDNGSGIPEHIKDKIFQPFFTTKPTGQGTGLGLSLAYDIVKAHGGEMKVETKEVEGTEFIIQLPVV
jgi:signal transduction histidine kinase